MTFQLTRHHALKDTFDWERFGDRLTVAVKRKNFNISAWAEATRMSRNTLYERMHGKPCSVELLFYLCREFDLDPWKFYRS